MKWFICLLGISMFSGGGITVRVDAQEVDDAFFELKIRPVLAEECRECHSRSTKTKGGLSLDSRDDLFKGGESGPALVSGQPEQSLLWKAVSHQSEDFAMPRNRPKLMPAELEDIRTWIEHGAPWPEALSLDAKAASWEDVFAKRMDWWSFQPLARAGPPDMGPGILHPVDRFIRQILRDKGLVHAAPAEPSALLRRLSLVLTGLPPTPAEYQRFGSDATNEGWAGAVDHYLASPAFGEAWARHWMDWVRYAESHGSEGDPAIPHAWRYRDYLVRSLNADVPCDQMIKEHIAGDLLPEPRWSADGTWDESALGTAHLRMVQHGFTPTDALDEFVTFTDNQVDVLTKAFLGLTVSCARCHDHKFDPISQKDYYGLFGIFAGNKPALIDISRPPGAGVQEAALAAKAAYRREIAALWSSRLDGILGKLRDWNPDAKATAEACSVGHPLSAWLLLRGSSSESAAKQWRDRKTEWENLKAANAGIPSGSSFFWKAGDKGFWNGDGIDPDSNEGLKGDFIPATSGDRLVEAILPPGLNSASLGSRRRALLFSRQFPSEGGSIHVRLAGAGGSRLRYSVQNYPRAGTVYPVEKLEDGKLKWKSWNVDYWKGDLLHWELATASDTPVEAAPEDKMSWFVVTRVQHGGKLPQEEGAPVFALLPGDTNAPANQGEMIRVYGQALRQAISEFAEGSMDEPAAMFLQEFLARGWLPNDARDHDVKSRETWMQAEAALGFPIRAPGVLEGEGTDFPLLERGNHRKPGSIVPRRYLSAINPAPCQSGTGRLPLAEAWVDPAHPLVARVMVNRLWHHVFGKGLVGTPDNFGRMGESPTHPLLLDYLVEKFVAEGWSIKSMIRLLTTSETFRQSLVPAEGTMEKDPDARWLSRYPLRRLTAESIRDSLLHVSGLLDPVTGGPPAARDSLRRSLYLPVIRNDLPPFLTVFDAPAPFSTRGARDTTNVPAQSLAMMNDPFVEKCASALADQAVSQSTDGGERVRHLYASALGRQPVAEEISQALEWVEGLVKPDVDASRELTDLRGGIEAIDRQIAAWQATSLRRDIPAAPEPGSGPEPDLEWDFSKGHQEIRKGLPSRLMGKAKIENGALVTGDDAWMETDPLPFGFRGKTLVAWVRLVELSQQGGAVVSVEGTGAHQFDALVFGERNPGQWMAGSNFFKRTKDFGGEAETRTAEQMIHLALVYDNDGTITLYRNGKVYGKPYASDGAVEWEKGTARLLFGMRHHPPGDHRMLGASIHRVQFYQKSLDRGSVQALLARDSVPPDERDWLSALSGEELARAERVLAERARLQALVSAREAVPVGEKEAWTRLVHAMLNLKEFVYLP